MKVGVLSEYFTGELEFTFNHITLHSEAKMHIARSSSTAGYSIFAAALQVPKGMAGY